ncbi:MAG: trypsin-like serine protease [Candidatus Dojkabacteria bacterium]|nr:trypsin-like serine protease [Candidatus Dojkabacteria bacterium]MDQ7020802.1 trypsin-like serine protease [Candidatus Dojkabacteria bacterium]
MNHIKNRKLIINSFIAAISGAILITLIFYISSSSNDNLSGKDTIAIVGGKVEYSYDSAGFMLTKKTGDNYTICGIVNIKPNLAITASNCVSNFDDAFVGYEQDITRLEDTIDIVDIALMSSDDIDLSKDLAIVELDEKVTDLARITSPKLGCNYKLVGYGQDRDDSKTAIVGIKKSIDVCIKEVDDYTFLLESEYGGGVCFGDSGSPIYERGTHKVVGVISTILVPQFQLTDCVRGNEAVAVRVDNYLTTVALLDDNEDIDQNIFSDNLNLNNNSISVNISNSEDNYKLNFEPNEITESDLDKLDIFFNEILSNNDYNLDDKLLNIISYSQLLAITGFIFSAFIFLYSMKKLISGRSSNSK